ncbi:hypothetical protein HOY80DRAFT_515080 [Tuber brumale]|nr:hypothetical protein HOY80DRAFT_515080 [Tuber brumale]
MILSSFWVMCIAELLICPLICHRQPPINQGISKKKGDILLLHVILKLPAQAGTDFPPGTWGTGTERRYHPKTALIGDPEISVIEHR